MLTKKQKQVLDTIMSFIGENGYSPSMREIGGRLGLSSTATVHQHVRALEKKGFIRTGGANSKRSLEPVRQDDFTVSATVVPLVGIVAAGTPIEAVEDVEHVEIPESFLSSGESFALRVRGDSMIEDGIHDGDIVVVRRQSRADNGQTVVALVNGEATLKRFYHRGPVVELCPANSTMKPIIARTEDVEIRGILVSLLRKFKV